MRKLIISALLAMTMSSSFAAVKEVSLFYAPTCPYCHYAKDFLFGTLAIEYPFVQFAQKNVQEPSNRGEFEKQLKKCKLDSYGIPLVVIGDKCFQGFAKGTTEKEYREALDISLSEKEKEIVEQAKAELAANPAAARKENAERVARAKAENIDVEKQNGNGLLYGLLGVLAAALLAVILFPKKKK